MRISINGKQYDTSKDDADEIAAIIKRVLSHEKVQKSEKIKQHNVSTFRFLNSLGQPTEGTAG